jgi:hypothetical protein
VAHNLLASQRWPWWIDGLFDARRPENNEFERHRWFRLHMSRAKEKKERKWPTFTFITETFQRHLMADNRTITLNNNLNSDEPNDCDGVEAKNDTHSRLWAFQLTQPVVHSKVKKRNSNEL